MSWRIDYTLNEIKAVIVITTHTLNGNRCGSLDAFVAAEGTGWTVAGLSTHIEFFNIENIVITTHM